MLKKILLISLSFFLLINTGFAEDGGCEGSDCINTTDFQISVGDISPIKSSLIQDTTEQTVNYTLGTIIEKLMIGLGSFAVLIMTIGAGYMVLYHGEDELLSKGKYIFMSGIIALVVALSSYYLISLLRYLLYN